MAAAPRARPRDRRSPAAIRSTGLLVRVFMFQSWELTLTFGQYSLPSLMAFWALANQKSVSDILDFHIRPQLEKLRDAICG